MRKRLTFISSLALLVSAMAMPTQVMAAAGDAGDATVTTSDGDIIHKDASRHTAGKRQMYLAEAGDVLTMSITVVEDGADADLVDTITLSLDNAVLTGTYTDGAVDGNVNAGACTIDWTDTNEAADPAVVTAGITCAGAGVNHTVTLPFTVTLPAGGSSVLTVSGITTAFKVFFFAAESNDNIYVGSGTLPAAAGDGDCTNPDFSSDAAAQGSVMEAMFAAFAAVDQDGDTIIICDGTYTYAADFEEYEGTDLYDGVISVEAETAGDVILDGDDSYQIFRTDDVDLDITGIEFLDGQMTGAGGAIFADDGDVTIADSTFTGNVATSSGGAVNVADGTLTVSNSTFDTNTADYGGAIYANAALTVSGSTFTNNEADDGGGAIFLHDGDHASEITGSTFEGNSAGTEWGGAIMAAEGGSLSITDSSFRENSAGYGGAIDQNATDFSLRRVSFVKNTATEGGGALAIGTPSRSSDLVGLSFRGNRAPTRGGRDVMLYTSGTNTTDRRMNANKRVWVREGVRKGSVMFVDVDHTPIPT